LGIRYPIVQAPMAGGWTTPELVAAVSNAGGLGMLAASGLSIEQTRDLIHKTHTLTERPFGVNFQFVPKETGNTDVLAAQRFLDWFRDTLGLPSAAEKTELALPPADVAAQVEAVIAEGVAVVSFALGDPAPLVPRLRTAGVRVFATVTTVDEARQVVAAGVDGVIAQGAEAGGHRSTFTSGPDGEVPLIGTLALVPQVVDAVDVPVIAAGGVMDGRGVLAALALGASAVQIGTRFLLATESGAGPSYRQRLIEATEVDTVVTRAFTGRAARSVRNRFIAEYERSGQEPLAWPLQRAAARDIYQAAQAQGNSDYYLLLAGQGLRMATREQGAAEIVAELVNQATAEIVRIGRFAT
jgi:nitronate monooxygenase